MVCLLLQQMDRQTNLCCSCPPARGIARSLRMLFFHFPDLLKLRLIINLLGVKLWEAAGQSGELGRAGEGQEGSPSPRPSLHSPTLPQELRQLFIHGPGSSSLGFYPELKGPRNWE